jgi:hypothetical protein
MVEVFNRLMISQYKFKIQVCSRTPSFRPPTLLGTEGEGQIPINRTHVGLEPSRKWRYHPQTQYFLGFT